MSVLVIAEAGVNHNGDKDMALALVDAAADAGADVVKFQTFKAEEVVSATAPKAAYQARTTDAAESQLEMLRRLELAPACHHKLAERCAARGIRFLSTPFDVDSLRFLADDMKLPTLKIASGEITNGPLLLEAGKSGCDIILSTGMSTLEEVGEALAVLAFGMSRPAQTPSETAFDDAFESSAGKAALEKRVVLLHCTSEYPAPLEDVNLKAMDTLSDVFGLPVGLSDHTDGIAVAIAAAARGAAIIEKHFTLDRSLPGPDHKASLEPDRLKDMIDGIRAVGQALGDGVKSPMPSEMSNREVVRKSLVALRAIANGETFSEENLGAKRPGSGISPMKFWDWLGRPATRDYSRDEIL